MFKSWWGETKRRGEMTENHSKQNEVHYYRKIRKERAQSEKWSFCYTDRLGVNPLLCTKDCITDGVQQGNLDFKIYMG